MFKLADSDGDLLLCGSEFRRVLRSKRKMHNALKITKIFAILMLPQQLNREEMKRIEKSDKAFSLMDRNRDNSISVDEFIKVNKAEASEIYS